MPDRSTTDRAKPLNCSHLTNVATTEMIDDSPFSNREDDLNINSEIIKALYFTVLRGQVN